MRPLRAWNLIPPHNLALGAAAKAGTTSLTKLTASFLGGDYREWRKERKFFGQIPKEMNKIGVIRHPVSRFYSLYANTQERPRSPNNLYAAVERRGPEALFELIVDKGVYYDVHFHPQHSVGLVEVDTLVRLESLEDWWEKNKQEGFPPLPVSNRSSYKGLLPLPSQLVTSISKLYERDMLLWEAAE